MSAQSSNWKATKADETPPVLIRWTMPESQTAEFNKYMHQLRVMSRVVGAETLVLEREVENVQTQLVLLSVLLLWGEDQASSVEPVSGRGRKAPVPGRRLSPHRAWQILPALAPSAQSLLPQAEQTAADELLRGTGECLRLAVTRLSGVLLAVDAVIAEVAEALGGHDPVHPSIRERLNATRATLDESRERVATFLGALDTPVRDEPSFDLLRGLLRS